MKTSFSVKQMKSVPESIALRLDPVIQRQFSAHDFHRVDMRSIAAEAGMSLRTIYEYFDSKETLLFWFIDRWISPLRNESILILNNQQSFKQQMLERLRLHLDFYVNHPLIGRIIFLTIPLERWMRDKSFAYKEPSVALLSAIKRAQARGELRKDIDDLVIFDALGAIFNRTFLMWEYRGRSQDPTRQFEQHFEIVWKGISATDATHPT